MNENFMISEIAKLHYVDGLRQKHIAELFELSPMQVSRYLKMAADRKIVQFIVHMPLKIDMKLGKRVAQKYKLLECVAVDDESVSGGDGRTAIAHYLANYVSAVLKEGDILGVSWGKGIYEFVKAFPYLDLKNIRIVQLAGGFSPDESYMFTSGHIITRLCARFTGSIPVYLNAPFYMPDIQTKRTLAEDAGVQKVYELAQRAHINIIGCSSLNDQMTMKEIGLVLEKDLREAKERGAIGEIGSYFVDSNGDFVHWSKAELYSGASLEQIKESKFTICIAAEQSKKEVLRAVLPKKYVNVLIVTRSLAENLL